MALTKIVIVGGGFARLNLTKKLEDKRGYEITLVDQNNNHFFPPLLYQVSTAFIEASNISYPFRRMFQSKTHFNFHMIKLKQIHTHRNSIETDKADCVHRSLVKLTSGTH